MQYIHGHIDDTWLHTTRFAGIKDSVAMCDTPHITARKDCLFNIYIAKFLRSPLTISGIQNLQLQIAMNSATEFKEGPIQE